MWEFWPKYIYFDLHANNDRNQGYGSKFEVKSITVVMFCGRRPQGYMLVNTHIVD